MIEDWIADWQAGQQGGAQKLYDQFKGEIYRLTSSIIANQQDAEEVTQDTFIYAFNHIHDFDPNRSKFRTWLHLVAISRSRDRLRKIKHEKISISISEEDHNQHLLIEDYPEKELILTESKIYYLQIVQRLKPKLREAIILRYWAEYSYKDIAFILRCPIPTVQSRVRLGLKRLQELINNTDKNFSLYVSQ